MAKCIKFSQMRIRHRWEKLPFGPEQITSLQCLSHFLNDVFWGANIIEHSPARIVCCSNAMETEDKNTWEAPEKDLLPLFNLVSAFLRIGEVPRSELLLARYKGLNRTRLTLAIAMELTDQEDIMVVSRERLEDLIAVYSLMAEEGLSFRDAVNLIY